VFLRIPYVFWGKYRAYVTISCHTQLQIADGFVTYTGDIYVCVCVCVVEVYIETQKGRSFFFVCVASLGTKNNQGNSRRCQYSYSFSL
jgi:hypothetical protein